MAWQIARSAALTTVAIVGSASLAVAQPPSRGGANPNAPRLMVSACRTPDKVLALLCADRIRSQIEGDVSFRSLYVMPKTDVENTLTASGYDPATALAAGDANALAKQIRADVYIDATIEKTGAGYKLSAGLVLQRDANMVQPLGTFEHARIENVAAQTSKAFQDVHNKVFDHQKTCFTMDRERKYAEANKAISDGLKAYPNSTWLRYCKLGMLRYQKGDPAEILKVAEEIRALDPMSKPALQQLISSYEALGNREKRIEALKALQKADPSNARLNADIANDLAAMGLYAEARPIVERAVAENPGDMNLIRTYWLVVTALADYKKALEVGEEMIKMDSAAADTSYFNKTIGVAMAMSDTTRAAAVAHRAGAKFPKVIDFPKLEASLLLTLKRNTESMAAARRVLAINPREPNIRIRIATAFLGAAPPQLDSAIAMAKEMIANGEDRNQAGGVAVQAGNIMRTNLDTLRAKGADAATMKEATLRTYAVTAWADSLATGTSLAPQGKFIMGLAALALGQIYVTEGADIGRKVSDEMRAMRPTPDAAKQRSMTDAVYPAACALITKGNEYLTVASGAVPAGGRFNPQAAQLVMGNLMQLNGYVEQTTRAYCRRS